MSYNQLFAITEGEHASSIVPVAGGVAELSDRLHARAISKAAETAAAQSRTQVEVRPREVSGSTIRPFGSLSASNETLAALLDQSLDCIKLISADGAVQYMNPGGQCAMEIDDFRTIDGRHWTDLWPQEARPLLLSALEEARTGKAVRFDVFCPTAKGSARWWDVSLFQVTDASGNSIGFLSVSRDVTGAQLAKEVAEVAAAEMMHRLGNSYAMVGSLLSAYARGNPQLEVFASEMRDRLTALAIAQTASIGDQHQNGGLKELLEDVLSAFATPACPIVVQPFADIRVDQSQAHALALVLGELAVNSSKHGALSATGKISLHAHGGAGAMTVRWEEMSDRAVERRQRPGGQGLDLMKRILESSGGVLTLDWMPCGLTAEIRIKRS
jgi:PAS domain S-box-containing protein